MLVITRKNGQKIMINDDIEITIVESKNGTCKVAIHAPKSFKIYREEIYVQIKLANLMGQTSSPDALNKASELFQQKDIKVNTQINNGESDDEEILFKEPSKTTKNTRVFIKKQKKDEL